MDNVGNVDIVTASRIEGWAADGRRPDAVVEVSIFVDGQKIGQIACSSFRPDLKNLYGGGNHGFRYNFPAPLPETRKCRVVVRHTSSGRALEPGEFWLHDRRVEVVRPQPPHEDDVQILPFPGEPRDIINALPLCQEDLYQWLARVQSEAGPVAAYYAAFGDVPPVMPPYPFDGSYSPKDALSGHLNSDEWQQNLIPIVLRAFPEKKRLIFIHVPKCAGTDLTWHLRQRHPSLHQATSDPNWTSRYVMFNRLSRLAQNLHVGHSVFVSGHRRLPRYVHEKLIRPTDDVFTVIREPASTVLSEINYIITRIETDRTSGRMLPDTVEWLESLKMSMPERAISQEEALEIGRAAMYKLLVRNATCRWLGEGDAESALDMLIRANVEVTDVKHYPQWLVERWGIVSDTRMNESTRYLTIGLLSAHDLDYLRDMRSEDAKLYTLIREALSCSSRTSVFGNELLGLTL